MHRKTKLNITIREIKYEKGEFKTYHTIHVYDDWFDFADYCKQENLQGFSVTILHWEYTGG